MTNAGTDLKIRTATLFLSLLLFVFLLARSTGILSHPAQEGPAPVVVELKGDIPNPGIYILDRESTIAQALARAGRTGDTEEYAGSRKLASGQSLELENSENHTKIRVERMQAAALFASGLKLDLNSVSIEDLMMIPQMRAEIAESVVRRRTETRWQRMDDLQEINGIGSKTAQKLKDYLDIFPRE